MEANKGPIYRLKWFWNIIKNGLFLYGLRNRMAIIGIDIEPMYWVLEGQGEINPPIIKENPSEYQTEFLNRSDVEDAGNRILGPMQKLLLVGFESGQKCIGLRYRNEIAALMFIELDEFIHKNKKIPLKSNEAYLLNMYTFEDFRGKNLAPYLRYQSYKILNEMGRNTIYSLSAYFNKSSIKFKKKLNAKNKKLYLFIELFRKFNWNFILKTY